MDQLEGYLAHNRSRVCLREVQEVPVQFQAVRAGGIGFGDAKPFAQVMMADGGATIAAAIANAIRASGVVVRVEPQDFVNILRRTEKPLVVYAQGGFFSTNHQYLTS